VRLVYWFVTAALALILIVFAVSNREEVSLSFWPFELEKPWPLYLVVLLALFVGFLLGEFVAWVNGRRWRREARARGRRIEALERELAATHSRLADAAPPPPVPVPLSPRN
jgi:uncharacterized integral membrane protein